MAQENDGLTIARERIAYESEVRSGFLDLGTLGLTTLPEELFQLSHLQRLNLGSYIWTTDEPTSAESNLANNKLSGPELERLAELPAIEILSASGTELASLQPLVQMGELRILQCSFTEVGDLTPLAGLAALQKLDCNATQVADLTPLAGLAALQKLDCNATQVADLTPLAGLAALQELDCYATQVADLTPLAGLAALQKLDCTGCCITSAPSEIWSNPSLQVVRVTQLPGVPTEVLSDPDNCLPALRAHLRDLAAGATIIPDVKLIILGNGRVGKTQIARRLRNEGYDAGVPSTHGIVVSSAPLPDADSSDAARLHLWDFGGQDIYHGTHALFMRSRAIFVIVWCTEAENNESHEHDGVLYRNRPLAYWLAYVRHFGGVDNPLLVVQTRCDRPEDDARRLPVPDEVLQGFRYCNSLLHYSALHDRGRAALDEALRETAAWLRGQQGTASIGAGRLRVQRRLEELRDADAKAPAEERQYRTLTQEHFEQICREKGGVNSPQYLLEYLHNTGLVFHRPGLFNDRIILDQGWALEAVYTVFHREKCYKHLRQGKGRFTRSLLELLVWGEYEKSEQELFLSLMESCGICFVHRKGNQTSETVYIAPELLPEKADIEAALEEKWDTGAPIKEAVFQYEMLHPGLLPSLVARIGGAAGINGVYWKDGVCVWERKTRSHALIEQETRDGWRGEIRVRAQGDAAALLLSILCDIVLKQQTTLGIRSSMSGSDDHVRGYIEYRSALAALTAEPVFEFGQARATANAEYCVSYAWGDGTEEGKARDLIVERLCTSAEARGILLVRDKSALGLGDSLPEFMARIGRGDRVFVILSDKYLKSYNCMFELFEIWRTSRQEKDAFLQRVRVYALPCAKVFSPLERAQYAVHWKKQKSDMQSVVDEHGLDVLGAAGYRDYARMRDFSHHVADILDFVTSVILPRTFEELEKVGLDDLEESAS